MTKLQKAQAEVKQSQKEEAINIFAIWFGKVLVDLRQHDLRLNRQPRTQSMYAQSPAHDKILAIRASVLK